MSDRFFVCSHDMDGGIYTLEISDSGDISVINFLHVDRPSYIIIENNELLAALREPQPCQSGVNRYRIEKDFSLTQIGETQLTHGAVCAHIYAHNENVYCVNYLSGTTILLPDRITAHTGRGTDPQRQLSSHPHQIQSTPDGNYMIVNDLGTDEIRIFDPQLLNQISVARTPDGSGARHGVFSDDGRYYYCVGEMGSNVSTYSYSDGRLEYIDTVSVIPRDFLGVNTSSAIRKRNGFVYVSNRGHDSVCVLREDNGALTVLGYIPVVGESPREFNFVGSFLVCGNENTDDITVFKMRADGFADYCGVRFSIKKPWGITERYEM